MFDLITRNKVRFNTVKGLITVEELWDMPLTSSSNFNLDVLAINLQAEIDKQGKIKSFVTKTTKADSMLELQFNAVKHIINVKLQEQEQALNKEAKKAQKQAILKALQKAKEDELQSKSPEELEKMLENLD